MKVKELITRLQQCNPEFDLVLAEIKVLHEGEGDDLPVEIGRVTPLGQVFEDTEDSQIYIFPAEDAEGNPVQVTPASDVREVLPNF